MLSFAGVTEAVALVEAPQLNRELRTFRVYTEAIRARPGTP